MKKGISLIVLVITIIVVIILAGAVILALTGNSPIEMAKQAVFKSDLDTFNNELSLWITNQYAESIGKVNITTVNATKTEGEYNGLKIQQIIPSMSDQYAEKFEIQAGKLVYIDSSDVKQSTWASELGIPVKFPKASTAGTESSPGTPKIINTTIDGEASNYNNPIIPAGFVAINTSEANWSSITTDWNKGLVIQDSIGNQFVWVPVDGTDVKYERWCTLGHAYSEEYIFDVDPPVGITTQEFKSNIESKYKGFYIARYESMFDYNGGDIRAASKKSENKTTTDWSTTRTDTYDKYIWNYVSYDDAKLYSENMGEKSGYDTSKVDTSLVSGAQWDTTVKWLETIGININDGGSWGNYNNSISPANVSGYGSLQVSGYSDYWRAGNLYNLSGNIWEWTSEDAPGGFIRRGGDFENVSAERPITYRDIMPREYQLYYLGFRTALYIR